MKKTISILIFLLCLTVSATIAETIPVPESFHVEDYTYEELSAIKNQIDVRMQELKVQYEMEHLDRRLEFMEQEVLVLQKHYIKKEPTVVRLTDSAPAQTTFRWSTSNPEVATVSNGGQVSALAPGDAVITATARDTEYLFASYTVHVAVPVEKVTLWAETDTLLLGQDPAQAETTLAFTVEPEDAWFQTVTWSSSKPEVATVDEFGTVRAVAPGTTIITAASDEDPELGNRQKKTDITLRVQQAVTSIQLDQTALQLTVGQRNAALTAVALPDNAGNRNVAFESDNPDVVAVDARGRLTAVAGGKANITVTAQDGSGVSAVCAVEVIQPITGLKLSADSIVLSVGDTYTLETEITPVDATNQTLVWTSSNVFVARVADGMIEVTGVGDCVITCATTDGTELSAQMTIHVPSFQIQNTTYIIPDKTGILIPVTLNQEDIILTLTGDDSLFTAEWVLNQGIQIQPKKAGEGTLVIENPAAPLDRTEVTIQIENNAVYNAQSYPPVTYLEILQAPADYQDQPISVYGKALQIQDVKDGFATFTLGTAGAGYTDQVFWAKVPMEAMNITIGTGDMFTVYGTFSMEHIYSEVLGAETLIPAIIVEQLEPEE